MRAMVVMAALAMAGCASKPPAKERPLNCTMGTAGQLTGCSYGAPENLEESLKREGEDYCAKQGKKLQDIKLEDGKNIAGLGIQGQEVHFVCADPGDSKGSK